MKKIILKAIYGKTFTYQKLPRLFLKIIKAELNKPINQIMLNYIKDIYDINKSELIKLMFTNILVSKYADNVIIRFNNIKIKKLKSGEPLFLETLIDLINYGNREIKGLNIIDNTINYINSHIFKLYNLSKLRGGSNIWR